MFPTVNGPTLPNVSELAKTEYHYETFGCFCSNQRGCFGFHLSLGDNGPVFKPETNGDGRCGVTSPTSAKNPWKFHGFSSENRGRQFGLPNPSIRYEFPSDEAFLVCFCCYSQKT